MGLNEFVYAGKSTRDFGIYCSGAETYSAPVRKYKTIEIKGKNGLVIEDEGAYENAPIGYKCLIIGDIENYERFKSFIMAHNGYNRLEDTFHPVEYRMAVLAESVTPTVKGNYDIASFGITFSAFPQRFLKSGEKFVRLSGNSVLMNNTDYTSKPLIRVYGNGTVTINNKSFTVSNVDEYVDVDVEEMDVYKGNTNMNNNFTGVFPELASGLNEITSTVDIDIKPRWYTI